MKVKVVDFEEGVLSFLRKVIATLPDSGYKFVAGAKLGSSIRDIESFLSSFADSDGCIDTGDVRKAVKAGIEASGDRVSFTVGDSRFSAILKPVTVTVTQADIEDAISSVEAMYR